jgi:hypothetical protein
MKLSCSPLIVQHGYRSQGALADSADADSYADPWTRHPP